MKRGFLFDMNRCVGCNACVIACQIQNDGVLVTPWRSVNTFNAQRQPALPLFHLSLACNHCEVPRCLEQCPADAYRINPETGSVDHDAERCIGCKYCTWTCPYDAPKYVGSRGVVEKCTLCKDRVADGKKPNCANLCPTGALDFAGIDDVTFDAVPEFVDKGLRPAVRIKPLRQKKSPVRNPQQEGVALPSIARKPVRTDERKVRPQEEWPLVAFTLLASLLVGLVAASLFRPFRVDPRAFAVAGLAGMALSTAHLGRKWRAWRALLHVSSSWLSREILLFVLFLAASTVSLLVPLGAAGSSVSAALGLMALFAVDKVYAIAEHSRPPGFFSASSLLTGLLFFSLFAEQFWLFTLLSGMKFLFYGMETVGAADRAPGRIILAAVRVVVGFIAPMFFLTDPLYGAALLVIAAEVINRLEYYADLVIVTPRLHLERELSRRNAI